MNTCIFWGSSDDLIEVQGVPGADEFCNARDDIVKGVFHIGGQLQIIALYDGCWSFSVGKVDEDVDWPDWPIRIKPSEHNAYSAQLEIDVPKYVSVSCIKGTDDENA